MHPTLHVCRTRVDIDEQLRSLGPFAILAAFGLHLEISSSTNNQLLVTHTMRRMLADEDAAGHLNDLIPEEGVHVPTCQRDHSRAYQILKKAMQVIGNNEEFEELRAPRPPLTQASSSQEGSQQPPPPGLPPQEMQPQVS